MIPIQDLINKIKWDKRENPKDYSLIFIDLNKEKEIPYTDILRLEGNFMIILNNKAEEVDIPLHRIRKVKKNKEIIWERR